MLLAPTPAAVRRRVGFTLIELLVVIAIISVLIALLLPAVQQAREAARRTQCLNHLKQVGLALHNYHDVHGRFPPGWVSSDSNGFSWMARILPQLDQGNLFQKINFAEASHSNPANLTVIQTALKVFRCPTDDGPDRYFQNSSITGRSVADQAVSNYVGNSGTLCFPNNTTVHFPTDGAFFRNSGISMRDIVDGTSNTFLVGERRWARSPVASNFGDAYWATTSDDWIQDVLATAGVNLNSPTFSARFSSRHTGGANFLFADGSVRFVGDALDSVEGATTPTTMGVYQRLASIKDGQPVGEF